jgi:hypothetical protein
MFKEQRLLWGLLRGVLRRRLMVVPKDRVYLGIIMVVTIPSNDMETHLVMAAYIL